jgi:hypothetical protein
LVIKKYSQNAPENKTPRESPPRKRTVISVEARMILLYSPKKNKAKAEEEYSTLNPATSSASASGKSKGARLVSTNIVIKKITKKGNNGQTKPVCA